jgi:hypothetical protein
MKIHIMKTAKTPIPVKPDKKNGDEMPAVVLLSLAKRLPGLASDGHNLHDLWTKAQLLPRDKDDLQKLWDNPVQALQNDAQLFCALPYALNILPQAIYSGSWLIYFDHAPKDIYSSHDRHKVVERKSAVEETKPATGNAGIGSLALKTSAYFKTNGNICQHEVGYGHAGAMRCTRRALPKSRFCDMHLS